MVVFQQSAGDNGSVIYFCKKLGKKMKKSMPLAEAFSQYFDVDLAISEELKKEVYKLRYRVYCEEFGYESKENFPDGFEFDEFEDRSLHCLITHKKTKMPAGCVRLVFGTDGELMPFEKFCPDSLDNSYIDKMKLDRNSICEISRLAVDSAFRRRVEEVRTRFGEIDAIDCSHDERRTFPLITVAAFLAVTALTDLSGRKNGFAMMEPFLPRLLRKSGLDFVRAGQDVDYHGLRAPYFGRTDHALKNMHPDLRHLYHVVFARISEQYKDSTASKNLYFMPTNYLSMGESVASSL